MNVIKRCWFAAAVTVLLVAIAFNLYVIYESTGQSPETSGTAGGQSSRERAPQHAQSGTGLPRTFSLVVAARDSATQLDCEALRKALESIGPVERAQIDGDGPGTVTVTVIEPVKLSKLADRLANFGAVVVERRSPLEGNLRLHVSGMTCQGCANALKGRLSTLEGIEVTGIDLRSVKEGYAHLSVAEDDSFDIASLKEAVGKTPFTLRDIEWTVEPKEVAENAL